MGRRLLLFFVTVLALGGPALASDVSLPKQTVAEIKSACDKAGGKFSQDARGYACGTNCQGGPGTACTVYCRDGERCTAQVVTARRPHNVLDALKVPEHKRR